jgi:hypothetical protein
MRLPAVKVPKQNLASEKPLDENTEVVVEVSFVVVTPGEMPMTMLVEVEVLLVGATVLVLLSVIAGDPFVVVTVLFVPEIVLTSVLVELVSVIEGLAGVMMLNPDAAVAVVFVAVELVAELELELVAPPVVVVVVLVPPGEGKINTTCASKETLSGRCWLSAMAAAPTAAVSSLENK